MPAEAIFKRFSSTLEPKIKDSLEYRYTRENDLRMI